MREVGQVGQILCSCGRVAELRTRANGKRLPFLMCKHCGMQQGKESLRAEWLASEKPNNSLGVYGEFPSGSDLPAPTSTKASETVEPEQIKTSSEAGVKHQVEWLPDETNPTETMVNELAKAPDKTSETSKETSNEKLSIGAKVGFGILTIAAAIFGLSKLK